MSSLQRWWIRLLVGFTDPYNHTYSESLWWKLFKNHQKTQIQRQRQWQRQRQRQRHRKSAWNTQLMLYFWNPDDSLIPNMMIDTSPWSSCSRQSPWSPWLPCSSPTFSSTGPSVSPFRDFFGLSQFISAPWLWCAGDNGLIILMEDGCQGAAENRPFKRGRFLSYLRSWDNQKSEMSQFLVIAHYGQKW